MVCRVLKKKNSMASSGINNFRRSPLERHSDSQDHQGAVKAKLLHKKMRTTTEKAVTKAENTPISHYKEMIEFLKFQGKLFFLDFFSWEVSFCQHLCPAWRVSSWCLNSYVLLEVIFIVFFKWSNRQHFHLPMIILHFSRSEFVVCLPNEFQTLVCLSWANEQRTQRWSV